MGLGFRLNLKWASPLHSHFHKSIPCSFFLPSSSVSGGKEGFSNSSRLSFLSVISEESESFFRDPIKACTFSSASTQIYEDGLSQREEIKVPSSDNVSSRTHFSLLMQNLGVLEETVADSDVSRLEREILLQLGRLGALKLFSACLSRTLETPNILDLSSIATEYVEESKGAERETDERKWMKVVRSGKSEERKSRKRRLESPNKALTSSELASETIWRDLQPPPNVYYSAGRAVKSRSRRILTTKNDAEMATGVKMVVKLERIRAALEKETGGIVSLSCWAKVAGLDDIVLRQQLHFGWHCQDELLRRTKSLVLYLARNYRGLDIALDDLVQAGKLGVLQGAERFDHTRGYKFSTYVHYWIRKSMSSLVSRHSRGILIPATLSKVINRIQKTRKAVKNNEGRHPDDDEIAKLTGFSLEKIQSAGNCLRVVGSIDQDIGDSFSGKHLEFIPDGLIKNPEESVMRQHMKKDIQDRLRALDSRERQILMLRYGVTNSEPKSLEEIGKMFKVTKEWIRKIEKNALRKLRDQETKGELSHYLNL